MDPVTMFFIELNCQSLVMIPTHTNRLTATWSCRSCTFQLFVHDFQLPVSPVYYFYLVVTPVDPLLFNYFNHLSIALRYLNFLCITFNYSISISLLLANYVTCLSVIIHYF